MALWMKYDYPHSQRSKDRHRGVECLAQGFEPGNLTSDPVLLTAHYRAEATDESGRKKLSLTASEWAVDQEWRIVPQTPSRLDSPTVANCW